MQKRSKKGFTLAELLIVVAIIAVLVAIAVPLFVGSLNDAEQRTFEANQHAVKSAAVVYILENKMDLAEVTGKEGGKVIQATGTFTDKGDFQKVVVTLEDTVTPTELSAWKSNKTSIIVQVDMTDVKKA